MKGNINLKNNIHLARGCTLSGNLYSIDIEDFVSLSNYVQVFSVSDDYKAAALTGGTLNQKERKRFSKSYSGNVKIGKCSIIGPFSIILPNSTIEEFVSVSPYSIIFNTLKKGIYFTCSKKKISRRTIKKLRKFIINIRNIQNQKNEILLILISNWAIFSIYFNLLKILSFFSFNI